MEVPWPHATPVAFHARMISVYVSNLHMFRQCNLAMEHPHGCFSDRSKIKTPIHREFPIAKFDSRRPVSCKGPYWPQEAWRRGGPWTRPFPAWSDQELNWFMDMSSSGIRCPILGAFRFASVVSLWPDNLKPSWSTSRISWVIQFATHWDDPPIVILELKYGKFKIQKRT